MVVRSIKPVVLVAMISTAFALGCGTDDTSTSTNRSTPPTDATAETDPTPSEQPDGPVVEVSIGDDHRIAGLPATLKVGGQLRLTNTSSTEAHELIAVRIPDDDERTVAELASLPPDELMKLVGGRIPDVVLFAMPNSEQMDGLDNDTFRETGRFLLFCQVPSGADPTVIVSSDRFVSGRFPAEYAELPSHMALGEYAELVVV